MLTLSSHEQPALVIGRRIHRSAHGVESTRGEPSFGRVEERARCVRVIPAFEEPEKSDAVAVKRGVRAVFDGGDAANGLAVPQREEQLPVRVFVKRILPVERVANGDAKRGNPLRVFVAAVDLPWKIDEAGEVA